MICKNFQLHGFSSLIPKIRMIFLREITPHTCHKPNFFPHPLQETAVDISHLVGRRTPCPLHGHLSSQYHPLASQNKKRGTGSSCFKQNPTSHPLTRNPFIFV
ncbi:hypothetical protein CEXT_547691 [Caerostris extrusa]|uniref:Uncharacterized protein n=1 Tax=Caerostris extrusa TaxID=172846 RepID=A0AAV4N2M8_CAEEX|nr:hypothetical protein CEXT_547691 [Caerostris extrusa]